MTNTYTQPSRSCAEDHAEMRERLKGLEVNAHHASAWRDNQTSNIDHIRARLRSTEQWVAKVQEHGRETQKIVTTVHQHTEELRELKTLVSRIHTGWIMIRGMANTAGTLILGWLLFSGRLDSDGVDQFRKLFGL